MIRLVQLKHPALGRAVAVVDEPNLRLLEKFKSIYELAQAAIQQKSTIAKLIGSPRGDSISYDEVYSGNSDWRLLPAFDHPAEPARCFVTGTGLTHKASAENRQSMHGKAETLTDSMKMYHIGMEGGRPKPGCVGASPEWFYKGVGTILKAHGEPLTVPGHAEDGGDEAEIAGVYVNGPDGTPYRVGLVQGNEFSDHVFEAKNYLYLASSKLRDASIGPELIIEPDFSDVPGEAIVERNGKPIWTGPCASGEKWMCHTMTNLEHHHFKHAEHRRPGDAHVHFFGADMFSFKDRLKLEDGDVMVVAFKRFGRPLRNPLEIETNQSSPIVVKAL
jgi:hypothetical protein